MKRRTPRATRPGPPRLYGGALAAVALDSDIAAVVIDDLRTQREADSGAGILLVVERFGDLEEPTGPVRIDTDSVVTHRDLPPVVPGIRARFGSEWVSRSDPRTGGP